MGRLRQLLIGGAAAIAALADGSDPALRIRPDDPIWREPPPLSVGKLVERPIDDAYDQMEKQFFRPGKPGDAGPPRALGVNTLGEVPDSAWYTNRHGRRRLPLDALLRGPGNQRAPESNGQWTILRAKSEGVTPGFVIKDGSGRSYVLKFDTPRAPNATTAVDVIGSKIFYALGYNTPENYIVRFRREQLTVADSAMVVDITGAKRRMTAYDVDKLLRQVQRLPDGRYRGLASLFVEGELIGPWLYNGARSDDPNDIYPHEHRRDIRGLYVFAAWLNHYDATSLNTLDTVVEQNGRRFVKHFLIDFGSILGSSAVGARDPRNGFVYQYDLAFAWKSAATLGLWAPKWQRVRYPDLPEAGRFEAEAFDPLDWKPIYPNPAFENRRPDDSYWAARQVMAFNDEEIRALVALGEYDDKAAADHIANTLIARRDKIGRAFFAQVAPLDHFAVREGRLVYEDLAVKHGFRGPVPVNTTGADALADAAPTGTIRTVTLTAGGQRVDVYLRKTPATWDVVGVDRLR